MGQKYAQKILHFYRYKCKDYELKTSPHYRAQKQRFARRRRRSRRNPRQQGLVLMSAIDATTNRDRPDSGGYLMFHLSRRAVPELRRLPAFLSFEANNPAAQRSPNLPFSVCHGSLPLRRSQLFLQVFGRMRGKRLAQNLIRFLEPFGRRSMSDSSVFLKLFGRQLGSIVFDAFHKIEPAIRRGLDRQPRRSSIHIVRSDVDRASRYPALLSRGISQHHPSESQLQVCIGATPGVEPLPRSLRSSLPRPLLGQVEVIRGILLRPQTSNRRIAPHLSFKYWVQGSAPAASRAGVTKIPALCR